MSVKPRPEGYHSVTPYLNVDDAAKALDFYRDAFGATELYRLPMGDRIGHAELRLGDSRIMLADEFPEMQNLGPNRRGGATAAFLVYVDDADAAFAKAIAAGATVDRPLRNEFYGDRTGTVVDPFGHKWSLATHVEDVDPEEMKRRMDAMSG